MTPHEPRYLVCGALFRESGSSLHEYVRKSEVCSDERYAIYVGEDDLASEIWV